MFDVSNNMFINFDCGNDRASLVMIVGVDGVMGVVVLGCVVLVLMEGGGLVNVVVGGGWWFFLRLVLMVRGYDDRFGVFDDGKKCFEKALNLNRWKSAFEKFI